MGMKIKGVDFSLRAVVRTLLFGDVGFGESYVDGSIFVKDSRFLWRDLMRLEEGRAKDRRLIPYRRQANNGSDVHYDLSATFYKALLGESMSYTGGAGESKSLDVLQDCKHRWHLDHLNIRSYDCLLECGAGWGAFREYLNESEAPSFGYEGICLSKEQVEFSRHSDGSRLGNIFLCDWRDAENKLNNFKYERFVSMGMLEHVGLKNLPDFFKWVRSSLTDDGVGTLQFIARDKPISSWADKVIFNGAEPPSLTTVKSLLRINGMQVTECEVSTESYVRTLLAWIDNLDRHKSWIVKTYGVRFFRTFELYLHGGVASFKSGDSKLVRMSFKVLTV